MDYEFPILVALWILVVALLVRRSDVKWEIFVTQMEAAPEEEGSELSFSGACPL